jgi:hypothetical protein
MSGRENSIEEERRNITREKEGNIESKRDQRTCYSKLMLICAHLFKNAHTCRTCTHMNACMLTRTHTTFGVVWTCRFIVDHIDDVACCIKSRKHPPSLTPRGSIPFSPASTFLGNTAPRIDHVPACMHANSSEQSFAGKTHFVHMHTHLLELGACDKRL